MAHGESAFAVSVGEAENLKKKGTSSALRAPSPKEKGLIFGIGA
jgi:hypothetical protein